MPNLELRKEKAEYKSKLIGIDTAILAVQRINTVCEKCEGKGRACAEDDRPDPNDPNDWITCPECHGSGGVTQQRKEGPRSTRKGGEDR